MQVVTTEKEEVRTEQLPKLSVIVSKGSMDMVYPAFMLATTAATMGLEVHMFFTFWGLSAVSKKHVGSLKVSPVGNPAMPMPNILGMLPGMTAMATRLMNGRMKKIKMPTIPDTIKTSKDLGVKLHACSTTMEVMAVKRGDLIDEIDDVVGAATFLELSSGGQTLFI